MKLSVGFLTGRAEPRLSWTLDAVATQAEPDDEIQIVAVDALEHVRKNDVVDADAREVLARAPMISVVVAPVRPNVWQGRYRLTREQWWATAASRNTFLCLAEHDYVAFLDDRSRPGPRWLAAVRRGERERRSAVAGAFRKVAREGSPPPIDDHRLSAHPEGLPDCGGGWLYGCTFCLPLAWALEVNGFEEGCDSISGEDYMFGLMLARNGRTIDFRPELFVEQDRAVGDESCLSTFRKRPEAGGAALERFGRRSRTEHTPDLNDMIARLAAGGGWPVPDPNAVDWLDGAPIGGR